MQNLSRYLPGLVVMTLCVAAVYLQSLYHPFVNIDDDYFILGNTVVHQFDWNRVWEIFTSFGRDYHYVPIFYLYFSVVYGTFGPDPFYFHLFSLIFHIANSCLIFYLLDKLTGKRNVSFFTAICFALHPLQVEAVCWATAVKTPLFSLFYILSLITYRSYRMQVAGDKVNASHFFLITTYLLFVFSMLTKTTAVTLPVMYLVLDYFIVGYREEKLFHFLKRFLPGKLIYLPVILVLFFVNSNAALKAPFQLNIPYGLLDHFIIIGHNIWFYIQKSIIPLNLSLYYNPPGKIGGLLSSYYYLSAVLGYLFAAFSIWLSVKSRNALLGVAFFFVPISMMLDTSFYIKDILLLSADRYYYLSGVGMFWLLALGIEYAASSFVVMKKGIVGIAVVIVMVTFGYLSFKQTRVWVSSIALFENTVSNQPSSEFFLRLGWEYYEIGDHQKAYENFRSGFKLMDKNMELRVKYTMMNTSPGEIGIVYGEKGRHDWAKKYFELAVEREPDNGIWWANLGHSHKALGDTTVADSYFRKAWELGFVPEKPMN